MKTLTHYEVYVVKHGRWALHARFGHSEQVQAQDLARTLQTTTDRATQVLEESAESENGQMIVRIVGQFGQPPIGTQGPSTDTNIVSRVFMVIVNAFGIGAIATMLMAISLASLREPGEHRSCAADGDQCRPRRTDLVQDRGRTRNRGNH